FVTAIASTSSGESPARSSAVSITGRTTSRWLRLATSGTGPPNLRWRSIWERTTSDRTWRPFSTTAAAVSSHEVSMPRTRTSVDRGEDLLPAQEGHRGVELTVGVTVLALRPPHVSGTALGDPLPRRLVDLPVREVSVQPPRLGGRAERHVQVGVEPAVGDELLRI